MMLWADYVRDICGIVLDESKAYLIECRLAPLAKEYGCSSWSAFHGVARADKTGVIRRKVIDAITTGETSFFRDAAPFELLRNKILPDLIDARRKMIPSGAVVPLRIWSAACSTGQEVYSIAIVLREILGEMKRFDIRIMGTDISDRVIAAASYGKYSRFDLDRGMSPEMVEKHFCRDGEFYRIRDEVRALITFKTLNLLDDIRFPYRFDLIFCRNVAIYFGENDRKRLFDRLATVMAVDGCLIIGSTESITGLCPQYESRRYLRSVFYQLKT